MAESTGMGSAAAMSSDKSDTGLNVKVVGLLGMAFTLMLMGLSLLPRPYGNGFAGFWTVGPAISEFAGVVMVVLGLIALWKGFTFWGSAFLAYGAFFVVWMNTAFNPPNLFPPGVELYGVAGVAFLFMLMTLTFLISSMKHGWVTFFLYLFFFISTILWLVEFWMGAAGNKVSDGQMWVTGAFTILTGVVAWYMATAQLTNWTYGKKLLPG